MSKHRRSPCHDHNKNDCPFQKAEATRRGLSLSKQDEQYFEKWVCPSCSIDSRCEVSAGSNCIEF